MALPHILQKLLTPRRTSLRLRKPAVSPRVYSHGKQFASSILALIVLGAVAGSFWLAFAGLMQKMRLTHMVQQVDGILLATHRALDVNKHVMETGTTDLLDVLSRLGQIERVSDDKDTRILTNPWGLPTRARSLPNNLIRIETTLPTAACQRIAQMFNKPEDMPNVQRIDLKVSGASWMLLFARSQGISANDEAIASYCDQAPVTDLALTLHVPDGKEQR